jgi:hypothetical protein
VSRGERDAATSRVAVEKILVGSERKGAQDRPAC